MNRLLTILSVLTAARKRLRANLGLACCALIALVAAVALSVSIPVYAEGASLRLLQAELAGQAEQTGRSPFALLFRYVGAWNTPLDWEQVAPADRFISGPGLAQFQLPLEGLARHARTDQLQLVLPATADGQPPVTRGVTLGFLSGMDGQIEILDGAAPVPATDLNQPVEVMLLRRFADEAGLNVSDQFMLRASAGNQVAPIPIRIAALWEPVNPADPAWFFPPDAFHDVMLVPEATFTGPIAAALADEVTQVLWFARLNGAQLTTAEAAPLLSRIEQVRTRAGSMVSGLQLEQSPADALGRYRRGVAVLTVQLFVFSVPVLGLVLYFISLIAALMVQRQRSEIALLKTRGIRDGQILGITLVEWLLLSALALGIAPFLGLGFATLMSRTRSFLQLAADMPPVALALTWGHLRFGLLAVVLALLAALLPAARAARRTLADEQQLAARTQHPPVWQRLYLDFLLLLPALYGLYQLRRGGGLQLGATQGSDPFANPLLLVVPVLLCFALGLFAVRLLPLLLEVLARLAARPVWTAPLIALRPLARQPGSYRGALLLLILTLSLAAFSTSMATTLDGALHTEITYQVGATTQLIETGQSTAQPGAGQQPQPADIQQEPRFLFIPVSAHLDVLGVQAATRVGRYDALVQLGGVNRPAQLVGIDRRDFPTVITHFDPAWAGGQSLGALMNRLGSVPDGAIVSPAMLAGGRTVGDPLPAVLSLYGDQREVSFTIVAVVDLWPGVYPQDGPFLIANLDYIFDQMGGQYPYDVWITRAPDAEVDTIATDVRALGITVVDVRDAATMIEQAQLQPRRQGVFGLLSVGFVTAGLVTAIGFLLTSLITARRRAVELGVLRALGLSGVQMVVALAIEHLLLVVVGVSVGTGIGLLAALLVVPLLQIGGGPYPGTPAYPPHIAWDQVTLMYVVAASALLVTVLALIWVLGRLRLLEAVKLGDAN